MAAWTLNHPSLLRSEQPLQGAVHVTQRAAQVFDPRTNSEVWI
jgi:hypothetical protein